MKSGHPIFFLLSITIFNFVLGNAQKLIASSPIPRVITPSGQRLHNKPQLLLTALVNYGGAIFPMGPICSVGIQLAVDAIRNRSILDRYELQVEPLDDFCSRPLGVRMVLDVVNNEGIYNKTNRVPLIAGTTCSQHIYFGTFLQHFHHIGVAGLTIVQEIFIKRSLYSPYFSVAPSMEIYNAAIPHFLRSNRWSKVYLLSEAIPYFGQLEDGLSQQLNEMNITLGGTAKIVSNSGTVPQPDHIESAVREIIAFDPRIIILSTNNGAILACWLHRYHLIGPNYVFIANPGAFFTPNSPARYDWCTEKMLYEILQSFFFFNFGAPPTMGSTETSTDSLGVGAKLYEEILKEKVDQPDLNSVWFLWKYLCYEEVTAGALILDAVEKELQQNGNDTLLNWVTSGETFRKNGSFVYNLMKKHAEKLRYKGLGSVSDNALNARTGVTGFHQMQTVQQPVANVSFSAAIRAKLVAWYDSADRKAKLMKTGPAYIWRTQDGQPPYDSLRIFALQDPIVPRSTNLAIRVISAFLILVMLAFFIATVRKRNIEDVKNSMPGLNGILLFGNVLVLCFVLILPADTRVESAETNCMTASLLLVVGFSLVSSSIIAKMHCAYASSRKRAELSPEKSRSSHFGRTMLSIVTRATRRHQSHQEKPKTPLKEIDRQKALENAVLGAKQVFDKNAKFAPIIVLGWSIGQGCVMAIWFGLEPIGLAQVNRNLEPSKNDLSLAYQHVTFACSVDPSSIYPTVFLLILAGCYVVVFLRSVLLTFMLRSLKSIDEINDLTLFRNASYIVGMTAIVGGAVIWLFYSSDPGMLEMAVCILSLLIVSLDTVVIFVPKIRTLFCNQH